MGGCASEDEIDRIAREVGWFDVEPMDDPCYSNNSKSKKPKKPKNRRGSKKNRTKSKKRRRLKSQKKRQTTKKYISRKSPPYKANEFCGKKKLGNDGAYYISKPDKNGICRWYKAKKFK